MSWWGKLLGGTFGFLLGGPLGALIGAALGHNFDKGLGRLGDEDVVPPDQQQRVQMAFFTASFSIMGHVAKADGSVTRDEIQLAQSVMTKMNLSAEMRRAAASLFEQGKQPDFPLEEVIAQFRRECARRQNLMRMFIEIQVQAAYADGQLHAAEDRLLLHICQLLGFQEQVYRQIEALIRASIGATDGGRQHGRGPVSHPAMDINAARKLLGVSEHALSTDVKRAYRRLMSQHHPDKLVAKGLPEEMIKLATERTQRIRAAYDVLNTKAG